MEFVDDKMDIKYEEEIKPGKKQNQGMMKKLGSDKVFLLAVDLKYSRLTVFVLFFAVIVWEMLVNVLLIADAPETTPDLIKPEADISEYKNKKCILATDQCSSSLPGTFLKHMTSSLWSDAVFYTH